MPCGNKLLLTYLYLGWSIIVALLYVGVVAIGEKKNFNYNRCIMETVETEEIVSSQSKATVKNMQPWGAGCALIWTMQL